MMHGITLRKAPSGSAFQVLSGPSLIAEIGRPKKTTFEKQIPLVLSWAELRNERATEIMAQIDPQYAFWSSIVYLHPDRTRRTFELINIVLQFCVYVEMRFKHALACYRPVEYNAQVQPMLTTPGHGTFPMGHATQAYAVAHVLKSLLKLNPAKPAHARVIEQLERQMARITTNRVIAGVHFPVDSMAGRMLGVALGEYFVGRCKAGHQFKRRKFIAAGIDNAPTTDFNPFNNAQKLNGGAFYSEASGGNISKSNLMEQVWYEAQHEWMGRFP
jgi:membrane-associated phospholipid phosphatase